MAYNRRLLIICSPVVLLLLRIFTKCAMMPLSRFWELAKHGGFEISDKWWEHFPLPIFHNDLLKLLWDFTVQTDRHLPYNRPDIVCVGFGNMCLIPIPHRYQSVLMSTCYHRKSQFK